MSLVGSCRPATRRSTPGSWRHPATEHGFLKASYYESLRARSRRAASTSCSSTTRLAMPGIYGGSVAEAVRTGARPVKLDLSIVLGVAAAVTSRIGLGATYSTTYYTPFHVARTFATLDHLSGGRAAWNVVTSVNDSEAQNYGMTEVLPHDARYDRADEFLEATVGLWDSWDDDALVLDRATRSSRTRPRSTSSTTTASGSRCAARSPFHGAPGPAGAAPGRIVGTGSGLRGALGRADLHRGSWHRHRAVALQGPEGADRRSGPNPDTVKMLPHGLHRRRGVEGPRRRARAAVPARPGRPDGVAHAALPS